MTESGLCDYMTLTELSYIVALAQEQHFGRAAERCHVSQPTLSIAVKKLEEELDVTLFERCKNGVQITPLGERIVAMAGGVLHQTAAIKDVAAADKDQLRGPLSLGTLPTIGPYLLPQFIPLLQKTAGQLSLYVEEGSQDSLTLKLRNGELDAILVTAPFSEPDVVTQPLFDEAFVLLLPAGHRLKGLLIGQALGVGSVDWSNYLPCDCAIVTKTASQKPLLPFTRATAQPAGWSWQIPLQHRMGQGYVYSSRFCSDAAAKSTLMRSLGGAALDDPRVIPFTTGHRRELWKHNCLSIGLASGFVEPLEATSIHMIARGMNFFLRYFPDCGCDSALIREYNRRMVADYEEIRDFIVLHYSGTARDDSPFWQWCKNIKLPDSLQERIELFKGHGVLREGVDELFRGSSWQSVFEGMGISPSVYCRQVENMDYAEIAAALTTAKAAIAGMVAHLPTHEDFLRAQTGQSAGPRGLVS